MPVTPHVPALSCHRGRGEWVGYEPCCCTDQRALIRAQQPLRHGRPQEAVRIYSSLDIYCMRSIDGLSTISCRFQVVAETVGTRCGLKSGKDACQVVFKLFQGFGPLGTFTLLASLSSLGTKGDYCVAEATRYQGCNQDAVLAAGDTQPQSRLETDRVLKDDLALGQILLRSLSWRVPIQETLG